MQQCMGRVCHRQRSSLDHAVAALRRLSAPSYWQREQTSRCRSTSGECVELLHLLFSQILYILLRKYCEEAQYYTVFPDLSNEETCLRTSNSFHPFPAYISLYLLPTSIFPSPLSASHPLSPHSSFLSPLQVWHSLPGVGVAVQGLQRWISSKEIPCCL